MYRQDVDNELDIYRKLTNFYNRKQMVNKTMKIGLCRELLPAKKRASNVIQ